jgi:hypothetical protein
VKNLSITLGAFLSATCLSMLPKDLFTSSIGMFLPAFASFIGITLAGILGHIFEVWKDWVFFFFS